MKKATTEVLCWGLLKATEEKKELSQEMETVASDGTVIKSDYKDASEWEKRCAFRDVYSTIISTSIIVLSSMAELFSEWWGLEFYTRRYR